MKNRILEFLKAENKSSAQFADEIGVQPSSISHIISGRNNPSLDFIMKMLTKYPALSTDWLLFGNGQMYREKQINDLFDYEANDNPETLKELPENKSDDDFRLYNNSTVTGSESIKERKTDHGVNKTKRIVWFFNDDTFKEYFPVDK
jgi:transcriptional regulator with XRE-family HTH domain